MTITQILQKIRSAFYTKAETDTKLNGKSDTSHNHNSTYLGIKAKAESAKSADSVAWTNVSDRPTKVSQFTNDSGYLTSGNVVDRTSNQSISGAKTFNNLIQTNSSLHTKDNICLRIQNIDNNETNPTQEIGSSAIGFTNKDASAWWAYNRYIRTTADGTAYLNLLCHPIKKSDGSYTTGGYINIYNTGFARVNDPLKMDPNATWNNNNIVTSNWVRKYFSNSIGDYWSKSATGNQYSRSTFSYLSTIDKATTNTSWSIYRPFRIVDKDNSIELGYVEYGYKSDLAFTRLYSCHNNGGVSDLTIYSNGISHFDNCKELWLINNNLGSYNTTPSNEIDTQIWFTDKNANKYATLQTDYYADGTRNFALTHKSLKTDTWTGLNIRTSPTDDVIISQPRFQAQNGLIVQNTDSNMFTDIRQGWIEMSHPNFCYIDFKHEISQDYLGRIGLNPSNILFLETINGAPIMANGKNIVRSINGVNADSNGDVNIADTYATKTELQKGLNTKADTSHLHSQYPTVSKMSTSGVGCIALLAYFPSNESDFSNNAGTTRPGSSLCEVYWRLSTSGSVSGSIYTGGDFIVVDKNSHKDGTWKQLNYTTMGYSQHAVISFWVRIS